MALVSQCVKFYGFTFSCLCTVIQYVSKIKGFGVPVGRGPTPKILSEFRDFGRQQWLNIKIDP